MPQYDTRKATRATTASQPLGKPAPVSAGYVTGPTDSGASVTMNVQSALGMNPTFKPGVFTGSHAGQFAGTMPEPGAEKVTKS